MIIHLDADAFFASVEQAGDPKLRGRPVAVGGTARGVVASASYEARRLGIYTTMPTARARKICPHLVVVPGDFEKYERFSRFMFSYAYDFTPSVEVSSIDEGYFDLRENRKHSAREVAEIIRKAIGQSLKISVSEGIGRNKLVSAVASKLKKPAALIEVASGQERDFLAPLEAKWLPGVGPKLAQTLRQAGLLHIGQLAGVHPEQLSILAGAGARQLQEFARGVDERPVVPEPPAAKSYGEQETFSADLTDEYLILAKLRSMADRLFAKARADQQAARVVEVRIRYNDFDEARRSESLSEPTDLETDVYGVLAGLLRKAWQRRVSLRLVGVRLSGLYPAVWQAALPLFASGADPAKRRSLALTMDQLRHQYGTSALMRGHDLYLREEGTREKPPTPQIIRRSTVRTDWAALNMKSAYSFLDSLLQPEQAVQLAAKNGCRAVALTDPNLHAVVDFSRAARAAGLHPVIGAEITAGSRRLLAYVRDETGYHNLCALLSLPVMTEADLASRQQGLLLRPGGFLPEVRYADPTERPMYEVLQSIRTLTLLNEKAATKRRGRFHFPLPGELTPEAARDSLEVAELCSFALELGGLRFPAFQPPDGSSGRAFLRRLTMEGARRRYGAQGRLTPQILAQIEEELAIIAEVGYEDYFLLVWEILQDCRGRGIDWITRGSAADSLVCYCLEISGVCPVRFELYFRRFLNRDRMALNKLPDIDIDFAHDRRDEVVDMIFARYGDRAAVVGGFNTFQGRSAFADIAKVFGVSEFQIRRMTEFIPRTPAGDIRQAVEQSQECRDLDYTEDPYVTALRLAGRLDGFPRHPKMHPCGIVLSRQPVTCLTPVFSSSKGYPTTHLDMDQVEAIGLVKMDILAQGGLAVLRDCRKMLAARGVNFDPAGLEPWQDLAVWKMIASGQARGVHHIESPAMTTLERMVAVDNIDDLIAIVSVIRPGAANNLKKEQFAARAQGLEPVDYTHPSLEPVLRSTYGVVAYEEHILQICEAFAGLDPGRADVLRRALVKCRQDQIIEIGREFVAAARARGRTKEEIAAVWKLVAGFQGYAFCRAHSTAYGIEAYEAAWLKHYFPAEFLACVLTHGKGFYSRLVYSLECRRLGVDFLPPDINASDKEGYRLENGKIRVPLRQVKGLTSSTLERAAVGRPYHSLRDFYLRTGPQHDEMDALIRVGAFDALEPSRTAQYWEFRGLARWPCRREQGWLLAADPTKLPQVPLHEPDRLQRLQDEMLLLGFTVSGHPLETFPGIAWDRYCPIKDLQDQSGRMVTVAGLIVEDRLHYQGDGRPMKFISLCDYTGIVECELFADTYRKFGLQTVRHPVVAVTGRVTAFANGNGCTMQVVRISPPAESLSEL